jgi:hypothetical protein
MTGGVKHDTGKSRWELLPFDSIEEIAKVLDFGAKKYGDRNWELGFNWTRLVGSLLRHVSAWAMGQDKDPETGLSHLAHAGCNLLFLLTFELRSIGKDDRVKHEKR